MRDLTTFRPAAGTVTAVCAAVGAGLTITAGAFVAFGVGQTDISTASIIGPPAAITATTAPSELATPFATPTYSAKPCAKRATMPC